MPRLPRRSLATVAALATVSAIADSACMVDMAPVGARRTPVGDGPVVVFDPLERPLPNPSTRRCLERESCPFFP
jgi:hypothetical protein